MKKHKIIPIVTAFFCLILTILVNPVCARADEVIATVQGTIQSGTKSDLLLLSTKDGKMEIKLDSATDASECKVLLPGREIRVSVSRGSDEYLHAVKITSDLQTPTGTVDSSKAVTVKGTLDEDSREDVLYLDTAQGEMEIKLDAATNMSGCSVLVLGRTYYITCARGSDAYMHAISIADSDPSSPMVPAGAYYDPDGNAVTSSVTGTVDIRTKGDLLYLSTKEGTMQFVIDSHTDTSRGRILTPDNKVTVYFYRGSDAYLHAAGTVGEKSSSQAPQLDTSAVVTVSGVVRGKSTENMLYLQTPQGDMELKLDALSSTESKALIKAQEVTVTCARGSDAYMHALTVSNG